jgi:hypothetical protein
MIAALPVKSTGLEAPVLCEAYKHADEHADSSRASSSEQEVAGITKPVMTPITAP